MRTCIGICILTAAFFNIPTTHAKIALNRATIVSISVVEDEKKGILLGSIVFERGSLGDKKSDRVIAKITNQTFLIGDRNRQVLNFSDLKPGMAIEIVVAGSRPRRRFGAFDEKKVGTPDDREKPDGGQGRLYLERIVFHRWEAARGTRKEGMPVGQAGTR